MSNGSRASVDSSSWAVLYSVSASVPAWPRRRTSLRCRKVGWRSEEHTSELQSPVHLHSFPTRRSSDLHPGAAGFVTLQHFRGGEEAGLEGRLRGHEQRVPGFRGFQLLGGLVLGLGIGAGVAEEAHELEVQEGGLEIGRAHV